MTQTAVHHPNASGDNAGRVLLRHISWEGYQKLLQDVGNSAVHLTFDAGLLEIEVPSDRHEQLKRAAARMVEAMFEELGVPFDPVGSTNWSDQTRLKGIEPDECYYVQHYEAVKSRRPIDLYVDPPPDLAIEVEVSHRAIDKIAVYRSVKIPEVWRISEEGLVTIYLLDSTGDYSLSASSRALPQLDPLVLQRLLLMLNPPGSATHFEMMQEFKTWMRSHFSNNP